MTVMFTLASLTAKILRMILTFSINLNIFINMNINNYSRELLHAFCVFERIGKGQG